VAEIPTVCRLIPRCQRLPQPVAVLVAEHLLASFCVVIVPTPQMAAPPVHLRVGQLSLRTLVA